MPNPLIDAPLPGSEPPYVRLTFMRDATQGISLSVVAADGPGFVSRDSMEHYEYLTAGEAYDVATTVLSTLLGVPW